MASQNGFPTTADAVWFTGPHRAEVRSEDVSRPAADQVTVKAITSLISAGTEMKFYRGEGVATFDAAVKDLPTARLGPRSSIKYAYQAVGTVVEAECHLSPRWTVAVVEIAAASAADQAVERTRGLRR